MSKKGKTAAEIDARIKISAENDEIIRKEFDVIKNFGDGNCLFRAIAQSINGNRVEITDEYKKIKEILCKYYEDNPWFRGDLNLPYYDEKINPETGSNQMEQHRLKLCHPEVLKKK